MTFVPSAFVDGCFSHFDSNLSTPLPNFLDPFLRACIDAFNAAQELDDSTSRPELDDSTPATVLAMVENSFHRPKWNDKP